MPALRKSVFEGERVIRAIFKGREQDGKASQFCKLMDFDILITDDEVEAANGGDQGQ